LQTGRPAGNDSILTRSLCWQKSDQSPGAHAAGMPLGLVLGAGGMVGVAYHAGILRALDLVGGLRPDDADLIVGTSAGSVVGAYLRSGFSTEDLWQLAMGTHDRLQALSGPEVQPFVTNELRRLATRSPVNLARLGVGSAAVLAMSLLRRRLNVPDRLLDVFPAGLFSMEEARRRFVR